MIIMKKLVAGVVTLGLSLAIVGTAGAEEISRPALPIQGNTTIETASIITPYNATKSYSEQKYFAKSSKYPGQSAIPTSMVKTLNDAKGVWVGTLYISKVTVAPNGWYVVYSGKLTLY